MTQPTNGNTMSTNEDVTPGRRRARTKHACEPCKTRKRKCDGQEPCSSCEHAGYQCYFGQQGQKKSKKLILVATPVSGSGVSHDILSTVSQSGIPQGSPSTVSPSGVPSGPLSTEMNSGVIFPTEIAAKFSDAKALRTQGYGWNLGLQMIQTRSEKSVTWIITKHEWDILLQVYLDRVHKIYNFIDVDDLLLKTVARWHDPQATNDFDHIIGGVAALACLFSSEDTHDKERLLLGCARELLETSLERDPNQSDTQAWLLRTLYLRCSSPPHAAWMASCTTMQIIEATGMNREDVVPDIESSLELTTQTEQLERRTFWIAKLLNTWIGWEYGRSRSNLAHSKQLPTRVAGDPTSDLIDLFLLSEVLEPEKQSSPTELAEVLSKVAEKNFTVDALILSQSNLCFTLYRRLRLMNTFGTASATQTVIRVGQQGLQASLSASLAGSPWWHVSNVPFQFACVLLAIDTRESLSKLHDAVNTLKTVAERFPTTVVHKAQTTLGQLVQMARIRREQDLTVLQNSIIENDTWQGVDETNLTAEQISTSLMGDLPWSASSFDGIDWNQFWTGSFDFSETSF